MESAIARPPAIGSPLATFDIATTKEHGARIE